MDNYVRCTIIAKRTYNVTDLIKLKKIICLALPNNVENLDFFLISKRITALHLYGARTRSHQWVHCALMNFDYAY